MLTVPHDTEHTSDAVCVWFRSSWNYTLRAEPTLSELEQSIGPSKTGLCVGSQALGTGLCGMSAGTGLFLAGNQGPFIFSAGTWVVISSSFIQLNQMLPEKLCGPTVRE